MFCAKAPRALRSKENLSVASVSPCWGKISSLTKKEVLNCGFQDSVLLCARHHKEQNESTRVSAAF